MAIGKGETTLILGGIGLAIAYFGIVRPVTNKLNLTQSQKAKAEAEIITIANNNNGWSPNFYSTYMKTNKGPFVIKNAASVTLLAKQINNAFGLINDDVNAIYAAFRLLNSQVDLSWLCAKYNELYQQDLLARLKAPWYYLKDGLTEAEFNVVANIVNKLPVNKTK